MPNYERIILCQIIEFILYLYIVHISIDYFQVRLVENSFCNRMLIFFIALLLYYAIFEIINQVYMKYSKNRPVKFIYK